MSLINSFVHPQAILAAKINICSYKINMCSNYQGIYSKGTYCSATTACIYLYLYIQYSVYPCGSWTRRSSFKLILSPNSDFHKNISSYIIMKVIYSTTPITQCLQIKVCVFYKYK